MTWKPYSLWSPNFDVVSGGIRVMYGLYAWLLAKGQTAFLNTAFENPEFIAIYPEIAHGNPFQAKTVVRYILNRPGVMASNGVPGPSSFPDTDILYYFSEMFDTSRRLRGNTLFLPILNLHVFLDQEKNRTKTAYFVGKGVDKHKHPEDAILIDRQFAQDQQALANLLNECEVLYSYDPVSAMTEIARLCGCRVVLVQDFFSRDEYKDYEPGDRKSVV